MGKVWIEVCLISARELRRSSLWKLQWFAVGWIDPKNKYCTKMDGSGNSQPIWKTKFATLIDSSGSGLPGLSLHVEVYSREPVFLRETLLGTASVPLKEFLSKHSRNDRKEKAAIEEVGSYQLRKGNSGKTLGFIDVAVHISEEGDVHSTYSSDEGIVVMDHDNNQMVMDHDNNQMALEKDDGSAQPQFHITRRSRENRRPGESRLVHNHNIPINETNDAGQTARTMQPQVETVCPPVRTMPPEGRAEYPTALPPPPPPSHVGFIPTVMPREKNLQGSYMNMAPPSTSVGPGFPSGLGAGAVAAGAVIFGDDFLSGFDYVVDGSTQEIRL